MPKEADILVVGGGGRIGAAVVRRLGPRARAVVRRPAGLGEEVVVADYAELPRRAFEGVDRVINCVGISGGPADLLRRVNVEVPSRFAAAARDAGVRQFIHVSSFSVYGGATRIDAATEPAPRGDYGRSKLAGDRALAALARPGFDILMLRLPLVYAADALGKLGQLLRVWRRVRLLPVPSSDVRRAMIGVELTAEVVAWLVEQPPSGGVAFAADPQPFTYAGAARARPERLGRIPLPAGAVGMARRLAPTLADRMFADSVLADRDNLAVQYGFPSRLYRDIAAAAL